MCTPPRRVAGTSRVTTYTRTRSAFSACPRHTRGQDKRGTCRCRELCVIPDRSGPAPVSDARWRWRAARPAILCCDRGGIIQYALRRGLSFSSHDVRVRLSHVGHYWGSAHEQANTAENAQQRERPACAPVSERRDGLEKGARRCEKARKKVREGARRRDKV